MCNVFCGDILSSNSNGRVHSCFRLQGSLVFLEDISSIQDWSAVFRQ